MKKAINLFLFAIGFFIFSSTSLMAQIPKPTKTQQKQMEKMKGKDTKGLDAFVKNTTKKPATVKNYNKKNNSNCKAQGKHSNHKGHTSKAKHHHKANSKYHNHKGQASKTKHHHKGHSKKSKGKYKKH